MAGPADYRWKKGQSGNPAGRKVGDPVTQLKRLCQEAAPQAVAALIRMLDDDKYAVDAAEALLNRGFGRPPQSHTIDANVTTHGGIDAPQRPFTIEEVETWLARRRQQLAELGGDKPLH